MPQAVVVGAGVAGISAAVYLVQRGWQVLLLEARACVGGRASSVWDATVGEFVDCGHHVFLGAYRDFLALLRCLGTAEGVTAGAPLRFLFCDGRASFLFDAGRAPGRLGFLAALGRITALSWAERWQLLRALHRLVFRQVPESTVEEFLCRMRQTQRARELFWYPLVLATLNAAPEEAALSLLRTVLREGFLGAGGAARFLQPRKSLLELLEPIGAWLAERGSQLRLATPVERLVFRGGAPVGVRTAEGELLTADACVLAVPPWVLPRLAPELAALPPYAAMLAALRYSAIVTLYLWLRERVLPEPICAFPSRELQWAFRRPTQSAAESLALVVSAADQLLRRPRQELLRGLLEAFQRYVPTFRPEMVAHARLMLEQRATLRLTPQLEALRPTGETPWRNLVLAGDWLRTGLPCTLEGAARSGRVAAERLSLAAQEIRAAVPTAVAW